MIVPLRCTLLLAFAVLCIASISSFASSSIIRRGDERQYDRDNDLSSIDERYDPSQDDMMRDTVPQSIVHDHDISYLDLSSHGYEQMQQGDGMEMMDDGDDAPPADAPPADAPPADAAPAGDAAAPPAPAGDSGAPPKRANSKRADGSTLPVSVFGVPSVSDEECVLCQFLVQRMQTRIAAKLDSPTAAAAAPAEVIAAGGKALPGSAGAAQEAMKTRRTNASLRTKPGGRGIVRTVSEDTLKQACAADKMPLLFNPYCSAFLEVNTISAIRKGIFFNMPTGEVCQQAALCRDDSYMNTNAAVHASKTSLFLNGQRGICGMLGGGNDRIDSREGMMIDALCKAHGTAFGKGVRGQPHLPKPI